MQTILQKYARLLVGYCLEVRPGDKILISTTTLAEPLVREVYRTALEAGADLVECDFNFREQEKIFLESASEIALRTNSPFRKMAMENFDCYLNIRAPFNLRELQNAPAGRRKIKTAAGEAISKIYFERTATRELRRNLCQFPTDASAQEAGMSLSEYENFVFGACNLFDDDPQQRWLDRRADQKRIIDHLNRCKTVRYLADGTDITFSTDGRTWINSDGQTNMPSGEVYTSPVENAVNGTVHFSFPCIFQGQEIEGVTLWVRDGFVEKWEARQGQKFLDEIFEIEGTRRFGEAAIGTNYNIQKMTKNILFDEKIGGTIHMAIGQSYLQTGGKNQSPVHLDMITDLKNGGEIFADGEKIYQSGQFLI